MSVDHVAFVRSLLKSIDDDVRGLEAKVLGGVLPDYTTYRALIGRREGLLAARRTIVESVSEEQRRFLGISAP